MDEPDRTPPDDLPDDSLPGLIASIDQLVALAPQMARAGRGLFDAYLDEGFSEAQAMAAAQLIQDPGSPP